MLFTAFFLCLFAVRSALAGQLEEAAKNINTFVFDSGSESDTRTNFENFASTSYNNGILTLNCKSNAVASARFRSRSDVCLNVVSYTHVELLVRADRDENYFYVGLMPFSSNCATFSDAKAKYSARNFNGEL